MDLEVPEGFRAFSYCVRFPASGKFIQLDAHLPEEIADEDAARALTMKLFGNLGLLTQGRDGTSEGNDSDICAKVTHRLDAIFLDVITNIAPNGSWTIEQLEILKLRGKNKRFANQVARAFDQGYSATFSKQESQILRLWRKLPFPDVSEVPGLSAWSPIAATSLLQFWGIYKGDKVDGYVKQVRRLGLEKAPVLVRDFLVEQDEVKVVFKGGTKRIFTLS